MSRIVFTSKLALAAVVALSVSGCAGRKAVWKESGGETKSTPVAAADSASAVEKGDAHWARRTDPKSIRAAISEWETVAAADPKNLDVLIKLTRAHYFLADGYLRDDDKAYLETMDKGVHWGELAMVAASPEFESKMRGKGKYEEAVKLVPKAGVPAMYWYASSLGKWAKRKGFAVLLGQKDAVKATMDRCLELDPNYYHGGPHRYFGAFYAIAPAFAGGDLEKSKVHFNKSLEIAPNYAGTKVLWAAELAVKQQDEDTFDKMIADVLALPDNAIEELVPEIMVEKQKARELQAQREDLF